MSLSLGIGLSLLSSVFKAGKSISTKIATTTTSEYTTSWAFRTVSFLLFGLLFALPTISFSLPSSTVFWGAVIGNSFCLSIATLLSTKAFKVSDISIVSPLMALVPVMTTIPAWIVLNETPTLLAGAGIILVTIGTYILQVQSTADSLVEPLVRFMNDEGAKYIAGMLLVVGFIPTIDKIGLSQTTPFVWVFATHFGTSVLLGFLVFRNDSVWSESVKSNWKPLCIIGVFNALIWIVQVFAYQFTYVAYVQAIKRVSVLIAISGGYYIFDETYIRNRIIGAVIMLCGVIAIIIGA